MKWWKVYTKPDSCFKKSHEEFGQLQTTSGKSKSWNSMGYFCPKNTFSQLKLYIQRIYLTLLPTTCVKFQQFLYVIFETMSDFSRRNSSVFLMYFLSSNITYFLRKCTQKKVYSTQSARFQKFYCLC